MVKIQQKNQQWLKLQCKLNLYNIFFLKHFFYRRCTKEFIGIDISKCSNIIKFCEIWYHRPEEEINEKKFPDMEEKSIIFVVNISDIIPSTKKDVKI